MTQIKVLSEDLRETIDDLEITPDRMKELTNALARSEGRYDLFVRAEDFGSVVRHRRSKPRLRDASGQIIAAAQTDGPLPVKSGRLAAGWNWKIQGTSAVVFSQVPYAEHARKADEPRGRGVKKVERFLRDDWDKVAGEMETVIAGWFL